MEALLLYLVKSCGLIALFWAAYHFLLRGETFFKSNRWFLLAGIVTSTVLPLVTFKKIIVVEPAPTLFAGGPFAAMPAPEPGFDWSIVLLIAYALGIALMLGRFAVDYFALRRTLRGRKILKQSDFRLVDTHENVAPFSYFKYIVYNSSLYDEVDLRNILEHEKVHSQQMHSIDMLAVRVYCIVFWFNPFAWLFKRAVLQNLEFIADSGAVQSVANKRSYQLTMLKVTAHMQNIDISNQFFQSLIKKRIVMLNKNQSNGLRSWKYLTVVPVLAAFLLYFQVRVVAQEKDYGMVNEAIAAAQSGVRMVIDKNTSDAQLKREAQNLKDQHGVTMKFSKVKRNSNGEITSIKAEFKDKNGKSGVTQVKSGDPISPISFYKNSDGSVGFGKGQSPLGHAREMEIFSREAPAAPLAPAPPIPGDRHPDVPAPPHPPIPGKALRTPPANDERHIIIKRGDDGKAQVYINGEPAADAEKILSEIESLRREANGDLVINTQGPKKFSREAAQMAREQVANLRPELEKMEIELAKIGPEIDRMQWRSLQDVGLSRQEMKKARKDMENARAEMLKAREEMLRAREELEKARK